MNVHARVKASNRVKSEDLEQFEVEGRIKWYDPTKCFGFITCANNIGDALMHRLYLEMSNIQKVHPGATVKAVVQRSKKGLKVVSILEIDNSTATPSTAVTHIKVEPETDWVRVEVKFIHNDRGYGFLSQLRYGSHPDIFFHLEHVRAAGIVKLVPGQRIFARFGRGPKGLTATHLKLR